jgi:cell wall-associated NlpC family hydrolase
VVRFPIHPSDGLAQHGPATRPVREELAFQRALIRLVGMPYVFGGRGYGGVDCSSLIVRGIRQVVRKAVSELPWMTADQLGKGARNLTQNIREVATWDLCLLAFFDWDEDGVFEHAAVRLLDWTWIWSSSTAGKVVRVDPSAVTMLQRQWMEIEGGLTGANSALRAVNWSAARQG